MKKILTTLACAALALCAMAQDESDISKLQLGMQAGVGYMTTLGDLNNNFGGGVEFTAGFTADYSKLRLKADLSYCQPKFNKTNMFDIKDEAGRDAQINSKTNPTQLSVGVQLGYKVWQNRRISVTPAAGVFYTHYAWDLSDIEWSKDDEGNDVFKVTDRHDVSSSNVSWMASVDVDIKLHERTTTEPFFLNHRYSRLSTYLRVTPWVAGGKLKKTVPSVSGMYAGVTVRVTGFMQSLGF